MDRPEGRHLGQKIRQEDYRVGYRAGRGLFLGAIPREQKPDYLGRDLFQPSADKVLFDLAEAEYHREFQHGNV